MTREHVHLAAPQRKLSNRVSLLLAAHQLKQLRYKPSAGHGVSRFIKKIKEAALLDAGDNYI